MDKLSVAFHRASAPATPAAGSAANDKLSLARPSDAMLSESSAADRPKAGTTPNEGDAQMPGKPPSMYSDGFRERQQKIEAIDRAVLWFVLGSIFGASGMTVLFIVGRASG